MLAHARWLWWCAVGYAGLILVGSSIPGQSIALPAWTWDKALHGVEYFVLGALLANAIGLRWRAAASIAAAAALCTLFGSLDELYQTTTPGRDSTPLDVIADFVGGTLGAVAIMLWHRWRQADGDCS